MTVENFGSTPCVTKKLALIYLRVDQDYYKPTLFDLRRKLEQYILCEQIAYSYTLGLFFGGFMKYVKNGRHQLHANYVLRYMLNSV